MFFLVGEAAAAYARSPETHSLVDACRLIAVLAALSGAFLRYGPKVLLVVPLVVGPLMPIHLPGLHGDEVHYLMIAESLHRDGDFAVRDEYAAHLGDRLNYGLPLDPHLGSKNGVPGASDYSLHLPGVALIAYPGWTFHSRRLVLLGFALATILIIREMDLLALACGARRWAAALGTTLVVLSQPLLPLSRQLFPEIPAALLLVHLGRRLAESDRFTPREHSRVAVLTVAGAAAALPWIHVRLLPLAGVLLLALAVRDRRMRFLPPVALAGSLAVMMVVFQRWYGSPLPNAMYGGTRFANPDPLRALLGLFLDSHVGLALVAPVVVVSLVAAPRLWKKARWWTATVAVVFIVALLIDASYDQWPLGFSTPGRFWASILPLSAPLVAAALERLPRTVATVGVLGAIPTILLLAFPAEGYPDSRTGTTLWTKLGARSLPVLIPGGSTSTLAAAVIGLALMAALAGAAWFLIHREATNRPVVAAPPA